MKIIRSWSKGIEMRRVLGLDGWIRGAVVVMRLAAQVAGLLRPLDFFMAMGAKSGTGHDISELAGAYVRDVFIGQDYEVGVVRRLYDLP